MEKGYRITCDSINYEVALSEGKMIHFISTSDKKFKTAEGLSIKNRYGDISKKDMNEGLQNFRGWARYVELSSGWWAGFDFKRPVTKFSKILFFFKRKAHLKHRASIACCRLKRLAKLKSTPKT